MNIASVPCRCGHSWTVPGTGPSERGTPVNCGPRSSSSASMRAPLHRGDDVRGLGDHRRAGRVEDHAAGPDQVERRADQLALQHDQREQVVGLAPPARLGAAAQRAEPGAGGVDEHPVEDRRRGTAPGCRRQRPRRPRPGTKPAVGGERAADQPGAAPAAARWRPAGRRARRPAPPAARPCRRGRRTGPARARRGPRAVPSASARATSCEPSSWTPARPSATAGTERGVAALHTTPYGE